MFDIENLETNLKLEEEGVWRPIGEGAEIKVARLGNAAYLKLLRTKYKANRAVLDMEDDLAQTMGEKIAIEVYARTILKDWRGIGSKGVPIEYSVENAEKLLGIKDFREKVKAYAETMELFQDKAEEKAIAD